MSPEELNRKVEFLIEYQAEFAIRQDRDHEMLVRGFDRLTGDVDRLTHKTMSEVHDRLQKLLEHNRQKLKDSEKFLRWQRRQFLKQRSSHRLE